MLNAESSGLTVSILGPLIVLSNNFLFSSSGSCDGTEMGGKRGQTFKMSRLGAQSPVGLMRNVRSVKVDASVISIIQVSMERWRRWSTREGHYLLMGSSIGCSRALAGESHQMRAARAASAPIGESSRFEPEKTSVTVTRRSKLTHYKHPSSLLSV